MNDVLIIFFVPFIIFWLKINEWSTVIKIRIPEEKKIAWGFVWTKKDSAKEERTKNLGYIIFQSEKQPMKLKENIFFFIGRNPGDWSEGKQKKRQISGKKEKNTEKVSGDMEK